MTPVKIPGPYIDFGRLQKVSEGAERVVLISPDYPQVVFKLQKPLAERLAATKGLKRFLLKHLPGFADHNLRLENKTYLDVCLRQPKIMATPPMARIFGFTMSEAGSLQVSEKISLDGATLGPSLDAVHKDGGLIEDDATGLSIFAANLLASKMPTHDLSGRNVVKGLGDDGQTRFALIDGIGDVKLIPMKKISASHQRAHLVRSFSKFEKYGLQFDPDSFRFERK